MKISEVVGCETTAVQGETLWSFLELRAISARVCHYERMLLNTNSHMIHLQSTNVIMTSSRVILLKSISMYWPDTEPKRTYISHKHKEQNTWHIHVGQNIICLTALKFRL